MVCTNTYGECGGGEAIKADFEPRANQSLIFLSLRGWYTCFSTLNRAQPGVKQYQFKRREDLSIGGGGGGGGGSRNMRNREVDV